MAEARESARMQAELNGSLASALDEIDRLYQSLQSVSPLPPVTSGSAQTRFRFLSFFSCRRPRGEWANGGLCGLQQSGFLLEYGPIPEEDLEAGQHGGGAGTAHSTHHHLTHNHIREATSGSGLD
jgi:hypothetical protein